MGGKSLERIKVGRKKVIKHFWEVEPKNLGSGYQWAANLRYALFSRHPSYATACEYFRAYVNTTLNFNVHCTIYDLIICFVILAKVWYTGISYRPSLSTFQVIFINIRLYLSVLEICLFEFACNFYQQST